MNEKTTKLLLNLVICVASAILSLFVWILEPLISSWIFWIGLIFFIFLSIIFFFLTILTIPDEKYKISIGVQFETKHKELADYIEDYHERYEDQLLDIIKHDLEKEDLLGYMYT